MQRLDGRLVLSASDLNDFLACEHLTALELAVLDGDLERPSEKAAQAEILARLGDEHERRYLERLRADGVEIVTIDRVWGAEGERFDRLRSQASATIDAMRRGAAAIYQATFFDSAWVGHADVLRRVEIPSGLGGWSYEVEDAKLARATKPYFLVQLCFYSAFVERIQGRAPAFMHVVHGDGTRATFRVDDFAAYYRAAKRRLEKRVGESSSDRTATYPHPVSHCGLCVWDARCSAQRRRDDDLSGVAGLTRLQERRLCGAGITTLAALGRSSEIACPSDMQRATFEKLARQARLQLEQRDAVAAGDADPYRYELLAVEEEPKDERSRGPRGLALLPAASAGDVFFDMEGDPFYDVAEGLEYLFGAYTRDEGFLAVWGCDRGAGPWHDRLAEKRAFEEFVDFAMARRARDPSMHIYHYGSYEKHKLKHLAQQHATREDQIDTLLREERLVDLLRVVRQSVVVGQPGYGLKKMEAFFGGRDAAAISAGDESVIEFERWRTNRDAAAAADAARDDILADIEAYNRQDCLSTSKLLDWLHARRAEAERAFGIPIPPFTGKADDDAAMLPKADVYADLKARLTAGIPDDFDSASASAGDLVWPRWLALHLLDYHRREEKPVWWAFFDRCETYADDPPRLLDDGECVIGLTLAGEPKAVKHSLEYPLHFPAQEIKVDRGAPFDPETKKRTGSSVTIEMQNGGGVARLLRGPSFRDLPLPSAIIVQNSFPSATLRAALSRFAEALLAGAPGSGRYRAAYDLLMAAPPRLRDRPVGARIQPERVDARALATLIEALDDSYLFIQGPPGSGKTYQAAQAIVRLLARGKRVGVTANSHKAIDNLLAEVELMARDSRVRFEGQRKLGDDAVYDSPLGAASTILPVTGQFSLGDGGLYAGTVWAFAGADTDAKIDVLFVDEAGQVALPNALAAATSARSVVLLGDPQQLSHVHHTSHPGDVGVSVLTRLLGAGRTVAQDRGVLLDHTWRMHPDICRFISRLMYDDRLQAVQGCERQRVDSDGLSGTGIRYVAVDHVDKRVRSHEEAAVIAEQIELLLRGAVTEASGRNRPLEPCDLIVVTPYNSQRRCIEAELAARGRGCERVRVGTVDKFQGQEAYVVFFSTANSNPEEAHRGLEFMFDRNRLNVAISRARALAVYVGSPTLLQAVASTIERMRALSAGCALVEYGGGIPGVSPFISTPPQAALARS